jgi:hypothetical protein
MYRRKLGRVVTLQLVLVLVPVLVQTIAIIYTKNYIKGTLVEVHRYI